MEGKKSGSGRTLRSSKSRSGCLTCKQRRLKCDEAKPACFQCEKSSLSCPGYQQVIKWDNKRSISIQNFNPKTRKKCSPNTTVFRSLPKSVQPKPDNNQSEATAGQTRSLDRSDPSETETSTSPGVDKQSSNETDNSDIDQAGIAIGEPAWSPSGLNPSYLDGLTTGDHSEVDMTGLPPEEVDLIMNMNPFNLPFGFHDSMVANMLFPEPPSSHNFGADLSQNVAARQLPEPLPQPHSHGCIDTCPQQRTKAMGKGDTQSLLRKFYRFEHCLPRTVVPTSTKLVEYYFSTICGLYSCFDSPLNPFRTAVSRAWNSSASTYFAIQSMSAAHLANELPYMRQQGIVLHQKASRYLADDVYKCCLHDQGSDNPLMNMLLLGLSACWQQANDLGLPYLRTARALMYAYLVRADESRATISQNRFFEEAMIYWELMMAFVRDEDDVITMHIALDDDQFSSKSSTDNSPAVTISDVTEPLSQIYPHPWTGISPKSQILLAEVGRLIRRVRIGKGRNALAEAQSFHLALELEETLLAMNPPSTNTNIFSGDPNTKNQDFITLAQATRDCGLLELYRVFPDLLQRRLGMNEELSNFDPEYGDEWSPRVRWQTWLTSFAIHILKLIESIPNSSGVRAQQILLILIAASELRLPLFNHVEVIDNPDMDMEISCSRSFARARLGQLAIQLPSQPVRVATNLVLEVWHRMDASVSAQKDDIFWIDVMVEKGWHTVMG